MRYRFDATQPAYGWNHLPLDDAWIHLSYAKNLIHYGYFTYSGGAIETGSTSPLWSLLLAVALAVTRQPILASKGLGLLIGAACVATSHVELRRASGRAAAWVGSLLLALDPMWVMGCTSGMEIPLAGLLLVMLIRQIRLARPWRSGLAMGLLVLTRPEMALPAIAGATLLLWSYHPPGEDRRTDFSRAWRTRLRCAFRCAAAASAVALPWFLYCRLGTGRWLPNTFYVKAGGLHWNRERFTVLYDILEHDFWPSPFLHDPVALILLLLGLVWLARGARRNPAALAWFLLPLAHLTSWSLLTAHGDGGAHPGEYLSFWFTRYLLPDLAPVFGLLGLGAGVLGAGLRRLGEALRTGLAPRADARVRRGLVAGLAALLLVGNVFGWWTYLGPLWLLGDGYARHWSAIAWYNDRACRVTFELQESAGRWIAAHVPADLTIATQDAGAVRYFTNNPLIDLVGLNSHEFFFASDKAVYLRRRHLRIAVLFPSDAYDPLFDFRTRPLQSFQTIPGGIAIGSVMDVREIIDP